MPTEEGLGKCPQVIPIMSGMLPGKGLVQAAEGKVLVTGIKGPLQEGSQQKVAALAVRIPLRS